MIQPLARRVREQWAWTKFCVRLRRVNEGNRQIILLQSSDPAYVPLLEVSAKANRSYAERMNYAYAQFVGNIGPRPQTANFNRYYMLREVARHTAFTWALWIDADAIVADPTVPVEPLIAADRDKLIIACRGCDAGEFDINNGIFLFNLRHRDTMRFLRYVIMASHHVWSQNSQFQSDQRHVQTWLRRRARASGRIDCVKRYAGREGNKFNYNGPFIKHMLRRSGSFEDRLDRLRAVEKECDAKLQAWDPS